MLAEIEAEQENKEFLRLMLKFDIRVRLIKGDKENYYKIWILRKDRKKKVYITDNYHKAGSVIVEPRLQDILNTIRLIVDVPESYKEYCMEWFPKPLQEDHVEALRSANRFKGILDRSEAKSIPIFHTSYKEINNDLEVDTEVDEMTEYFNEYKIKRYRNLGFTTIRLREQSEYNYLRDLGDNMKYLEKLLKAYGFDDNTGDFNKSDFPVPRSDKELEGIKNDITNFNNEVNNSYKYLKQLAGKYGKNLSPKGVIIYPPSKSKDKHVTSTNPIIIKLS